MKNILLTGGSGFIGKNIQESFLNEKYIITAPSSRELNVADEKSVARYFVSHHPDVVIHAAVKPGHRNAKDFDHLFYTNSRMFFNLERYSDQYQKMLVIGSGAIYDNRNYRPKVREEDWKNNIPVDEHGFCKYVCEKVIEHSRNIYDLRIFGIFGKYEDYAIRFISNAICKAIFGFPITIKQNRKFDYLYINDLMSVLDWFISDTPLYKSYNITPDQSISLYDLAVLVKKISGKEELPILVAQDGMGLEYSGDNSRLKAEYNLHLTTLEEAIKDLYTWYTIHFEELDEKKLLVDK